MTRTEAIRYREIIETAAQHLNDSIALTAVTLYPEWAENAVCSAGWKVRRNGRLYRCLQDHTSLTGWEPENTPALWEQINEVHTGTPEDPIPYEGNMTLESGKYYSQDGVVYLCIRDTGSPVYNALEDLVGLYVEIAG